MLLSTTVSSRGFLRGCLLVRLETRPTASQGLLSWIAGYRVLKGAMKGPLGRRLREGTFVGSGQGRAELLGCKAKAWRLGEVGLGAVHSSEEWGYMSLSFESRGVSLCSHQLCGYRQEASPL